MSAENKAVVRRCFKEIWSKGNIDLIDQLVAPNYAHHDSAGPMPGAGRDGFKQHVTAYRTAFPDLTFTVDDILAEDNKVTARWTARGTHIGTLLGMAPTGKQVTTEGISVLRIANGKLAESWVTWDTWGLMKQIGVAESLYMGVGAGR
jgi:steroid delta-isomerase-like uncharacterized protein